MNKRILIAIITIIILIFIIIGLILIYLQKNDMKVAPVSGENNNLNLPATSTSIDVQPTGLVYPQEIIEERALTAAEREKYNLEPGQPASLKVLTNPYNPSATIKVVEFIKDETTNDSDSDGLSDEQEQELGTDPNKADTDEDGLDDADEIRLGFDPVRSDSNNDGILDSDDIKNNN